MITTSKICFRINRSGSRLRYVLLLLLCCTGQAYSQSRVVVKTPFDSVSFASVKKQLNMLPDEAYLKREYKKDGRKLPYRILFPAQYDQTKKYPLVITLHNSSRLGHDNEKQLEPLARIWLRPEIRQQYPTFVIAPQFENRSSSYSEDSAKGILVSKPGAEVELLIQLIEQLKREPGIDDKSIYVMGYSMGGSTAQNLASLRPDLFAAIVSIAGVPDFSNVGQFKKIPTWLIHGRRDNENPFAGSEALYQTIKGGKQARYSVYEYLDHNNIHFPFLCSDDIPRWLFAKKK